MIPGTIFGASQFWFSSNLHATKETQNYDGSHCLLKNLQYDFYSVTLFSWTCDTTSSQKCYTELFTRDEDQTRSGREACCGFLSQNTQSSWKHQDVILSPTSNELESLNRLWFTHVKCHLLFFYYPTLFSPSL